MRTRNSYFPNNSSVIIPRRQNKRRTPNVVELELRTIVEVAPMADNRTMEEATPSTHGRCMRTRNSYFLNNSSSIIPRRRNNRRTPNIVEPELRTIIEMADNRIMEELLQAPTEGYGEAIVIPEINADHFEIKTNLLQLVQVNLYHGFERENPHTHINNFKRITSTLKFRDVPNDAWERFKKMLRACPHHGFMELAQIDTFYNSLNDNDQDSLNATAGKNLLSKTTREALQIVENKSKVRYSRTKLNVFRKNTTSRDDASKSYDRIDKLEDQMLTLVDIFAKKIVTPALVKAVEESCVTCGDLHFDISFADALLLMLKFASTIKSLLTNKDKLFELAKIPLNENCSAMLLRNLPKKLRDPCKFLIPCDFLGMDVCHALADLSASINLMPLSIWKKVSLPELSPTQMTLEIADRSITRPKGVTEEVFVKAGKFHFLADFVVVDIEADPRTTRYSFTYDDLSVNRIDIINVAREEYAQEILGFSNNSSSGNPTSTFEPILSDSSLSLLRSRERRIIAFTELKILEWHTYKHLDWITVRRDDDKIYKFKEGDFKRLRIQDIKDMHVEYLQLSVKSFQKKLNLTKPNTYRFDLKCKEDYIAYSNLRGFIYQNKDKLYMLMWIDELHKFNDGTLTDVRTALDDRLKGIRMKYLP
uniref:Reverse transcriptase domain-containing protein n=1 Tax=Tanacetum cinerariifolium TaxID=118510 RepID=A0A6L2NCZ0_TANCI|nr:reverse transcriptase domain-containing protein [Tanacetum cinerariifolium]